MTNHHQEVQQLLAEASRLPTGPTQLSLLESAVSLLDAMNDVDQGFSLRQRLINVASDTGRGDVLLVHFSWCLAQFDRFPGRFPAHSLHWHYKWVVSASPRFPEISRAQIEQLLQDLGRRYQQVGGSLFAMWQLRRGVMVDMGDVDEARAAQRQLRKTRRGYLSDCPACVASCAAKYYFFIHRPAQALRTMNPLFEGKLTCSEEPIVSVSRALPYLHAAGRVEEARVFQHKYAAELRRHVKLTESVANHIEFLTLDGEYAAALRLLDRHFEQAATDVDLLRRMVFYNSARKLMMRLAANGKRHIKLRLPVSFQEADSGEQLGSGETKPAEWADWFSRQSTRIAARFDARNGNNLYARKARETD